jgi:hypothetical protein
VEVLMINDWKTTDWEYISWHVFELLPILQFGW